MSDPAAAGPGLQKGTGNYNPEFGGGYYSGGFDEFVRQGMPTSPWTEPGPLPEPDYGKPRVDASGGDVGGGDLIEGGPFKGWTPEAMRQWHEASGGGGSPGVQTDNGYYDPQYGWIPHAQLANEMASNNFWDYMNPWGGTSKGGSGTGDPTQRWVGRGVGTVTNIFVPGAGYVTGPIARWITSKIQGGAKLPDVMAAVKKYLPTGGGGDGGGGGPAAAGTAPGPVFGTGGYPKGYLAKWYGKGMGGEFGRPGGAGEPGEFGSNASNFGSNTTSFFGGGGNPNLPTGGSYFTTSGGMPQVVGGGGFGNLGGSGTVDASALSSRAPLRMPWYYGQNYAGHSTDAPSGTMWTPEQHAALQNMIGGGAFASRVSRGSPFKVTD